MKEYIFLYLRETKRNLGYVILYQMPLSKGRPQYGLMDTSKSTNDHFMAECIFLYLRETKYLGSHFTVL